MTDDNSALNEDPGHAAAAWWSRRDAGPLTDTEERDFQTWLDASPAHRAAYEEICAVCDAVRALRPAPAQRPRAPRRGARLTWAAAGSLLAAGLAGLIWFDEAMIALRSDFRTSTGETRVISLEDGSRVHLGAKSSVAVDLLGVDRRIALLEGEALFEAAPNRERPFVVEAGVGQITALGTAFDVSLLGGVTRVTVTEHAVAVVAQGREVRVPQRQQSAFGEDSAPTPPRPVDAEGVTAWRRGKLIFEQQPLGEVVATLARYHHGLVIVPSASLRGLAVTGVFDADDPIGALRVIEESLGLRSIRLTDYLILLHG